MSDATESLRAALNAWKPWAYPYSEIGMCEMCGEIDGHGPVDKELPSERPCLVGAFQIALARPEAAERLRLAVLELKGLLSEGGYSIVLDSGKPMGIGEYFPVAGVLERIDKELAALALEETPSPDAGREAGPGSKSPVGQNG